MLRLLYSSKFWALILGGVTLLAMKLFAAEQADVDAVLTSVLAIYASIAPIIYAIMNAVEDAAEKGSGQLSLEDIIQIIKDILDEWEPKSE